MAALVKRDGLAEQGAGARDEGLSLLVVGEGKLVVDERRRVGNEVERAVGIRLGEGVAVLGETAAERREGDRRVTRVIAVEAAGKPQAKPLVVLAMWVKRHGPSLPVASHYRA